MPSAKSLGSQVAAWIGENITVAQGPRAGQPFKVLPWQRRFLDQAFAPGVEQVGLSIGRGNGKSAFVAAIAAAALDGPLHEPLADTLIVAAGSEQGRIIFRFAKRYLGAESWGEWKVSDSPARRGIEHRGTGANIRVLSSDPRRAHGFAPVLALADEAAQWPGNTVDEMFAALTTSLGKVEGGRFIALGTRPAAGDHAFQRLLDAGGELPGVFSMTYAAPPDCDPFDPKNWAAANPSLPHMPHLRRTIEREAAAAKKDAALLPAFKALRLNQGTHDTAQSLVISAPAWVELAETAELPPQAGPVIWGFDLGGSTSWSAVVGYHPETGRLEALAAVPETPTLERRGLTDGVGNRYRRMADEGSVIQVGERTTSIPALVAEAKRRFGAPVAVMGDKWREHELAQALREHGIGAPLVFRGGGFKHGSEDLRRFRRAVHEGRVKTPPRLLLRAALADARTVFDQSRSGNERLGSITEGGRRRRVKDDAVVAMICAVAEGERRRDQPAGCVVEIG